MRPTIRSLVALAALSACGGPTLDNARGSVLVVDPHPNVVTGPPEGFRVTFQYDPAQGCMELPSSARALVNGVAVPDFIRGSGRGGNFLFPRCEPPSFVAPLAMLDGPETSFIFEDGDRRAGMVVRALSGGISAVMTPPQGGQIRAGSTVGLSYTPATDNLSEMQAELVTSPRPDGMRLIVSLRLASFQNGSGTLTIPANAPPGPATFRILGTRQPAVTACLGAEICQPAYWMSDVSHPVPFRAPSVSFEIEP